MENPKRKLKYLKKSERINIINELKKTQQHVDAFSEDFLTKIKGLYYLACKSVSQLTC